MSLDQIQTPASVIHMHPVRDVGGWMQWCDDKEAERFALYRVDDDQIGTSVWVADFQDKPDAMIAMAALEQAGRLSVSRSAQTDYAVAPGECLQEWLQDNDISVAQFAETTGKSPQWVNGLIAGTHTITDEISRLLQQITSIPAQMWLRHEAAFQADLVRLGAAMGQDSDTTAINCPFFCQHIAHPG